MDYTNISIIFNSSVHLISVLHFDEMKLCTIHLNPFLKSQGFAVSSGEQNYGGGESSTTEIYYLILHVGRDS